MRCLRKVNYRLRTGAKSLNCNAVSRWRAMAWVTEGTNGGGYRRRVPPVGGLSAAGALALEGGSADAQATRDGRRRRMAAATGRPPLLAVHDDPGIRAMLA